MADELKKQVITLEDGRKAERIVQEISDEGKTITELWEDPKIEKKLTKRIVEHKKPIIYRREIETIDENTGEITEKQIESIEPEVKMQLREVIESESKLKMQSFQEDCDCSVTREDLKSAIETAVRAIAENMQEKVSMMSEPEIKKLSATQILSEKSKVSEESDFDLIKIILWAIIGVLTVSFVYVGLLS